MTLFAPFARKLRNDGVNPKNYPYARELAMLIPHMVQVAGPDDERICDRFEQSLSFKEVGRLLAECGTFIGVDSYLQHHAWFVNKPGIVLWGQSDPVIFGHDLHTNLLKDRRFLRPNQFDIWEACPVNDEAFVSPEEVTQALWSYK